MFLKYKMILLQFISEGLYWSKNVWKKDKIKILHEKSIQEYDDFTIG